MSDTFDHGFDTLGQMEEGYPDTLGQMEEGYPHIPEPTGAHKLKGRFVWVDRFGNRHPVGEMETRHLFFSLRMIWNHSAPAHMRIEPYKRYLIMRTPEYLKEAIRAFIAELGSRDDLTPYYIKCLKHMNDCLQEFFSTDKIEG